MEAIEKSCSTCKRGDFCTVVWCYNNCKNYKEWQPKPTQASCSACAHQSTLTCIDCASCVTPLWEPKKDDMKNLADLPSAIPEDMLDKLMTNGDNFKTSVAIKALAKEDKVNSPSHYVIKDGMEVIDIRDAILDNWNKQSKLSYKQVDYWSRAWEYLTRSFEKNGKEDLMKAKWYLERLIEVTE